MISYKIITTAAAARNAHFSSLHSIIFWFNVSIILIFTHEVNSITFNSNVQHRKQFLSQGPLLVTTAIAQPASAKESNEFQNERSVARKNVGVTDLDLESKFDNLYSLLEGKTVSWINGTTFSFQDRNNDVASFSKYRYSTSSLSMSNSRTNSNVEFTKSRNNITPSAPCPFPNWTDGYWSTKYKFKGASFPQ